MFIALTNAVLGAMSPPQIKAPSERENRRIKKEKSGEGKRRELLKWGIGRSPAGHAFLRILKAT